MPEIGNLSLTASSAHAVEAIINRLSAQFCSVESIHFQKSCAREAANLPSQLREYLLAIASGHVNEGAYIISGFFIDDEKIGDSPAHWDVPWENRPFLREEIFQCLISSAIGNLFGWRTQENGRCLRHIVPIKSDENEQLGGSSKASLVWHTEEAFHPARADFFSLMCYRNNEKAETLLANVRHIDVDEDTRSILHQDRFFVKPDKSHLPHNNQSTHWRMQSEQFQKIRQMLEKPSQLPVLYGTKDHQLMHVDQAFMYVNDNDQKAKEALDKFHAALDASAWRIVMEPGQIVIIDNLATAHARSSYVPDYGAKQRWMRRVNIRNGRRSCLSYAEYENSHIME